MKALLRFLLPLVQHKDGKLSDAKVRINAAFVVVSVLFVRHYWNHAFDTEPLLIYLGLASGHAAYSKYLETRNTTQPSKE